jgi:peptidoglycan-associated lipoprotein
MSGAVTLTRTLLIACAVMAGCATVGLEPRREGDVAPVETIDPVTGLRPGDPANTAATSSVANVEVVEAPKPEPLPDAPRVVYFDFDSYRIKDPYGQTLEVHARRLLADEAARLRINGHTDERGGREYNLALGQKRAETVAKTLTGLGVAWSRLESVSYGEEQPAVKGRSEQARARNRRAELEYR